MFTPRFSTLALPAAALSAAALLAGCETMTLGEMRAGNPPPAQTRPAPTPHSARPPAPQMPVAQTPPPVAPPSAASGGIPLTTYGTYNENDFSFLLQLMPQGRAVFMDRSLDMPHTRDSGTWTQQGARIHVQIKQPKGRTLRFVFEYRAELRSPTNVVPGCKRYAPGLYPISQDGKPITNREISSDLHFWPEMYTKAGKSPCLVR